MIWLISAGRTAGGWPVTGPPARRRAGPGPRRWRGRRSGYGGGGRRPGARRRGGGLRFRLGMGVAADLLRDGQPGRGAVPADLDDGQVERVEDALDFPPGQLRAGLIDTAEQLDRGVLADQAVLGPQERLPQPLRRRGGERGASQPPVHRRLPGLAVRPDMVDGLIPGGEQPVQPRQVLEAGPVADLDEELPPDYTEKTFDLAPALAL